VRRLARADVDVVARCRGARLRRRSARSIAHARAVAARGARSLRGARRRWSRRSRKALTACHLRHLRVRPAQSVRADGDMPDGSPAPRPSDRPVVAGERVAPLEPITHGRPRRRRRRRIPRACRWARSPPCA
jgi:hypothetical protein